MVKTLEIPELKLHQAVAFWDKVDIRGPKECWPWKSVISKGRAKVFINKVTYQAPRVAYTLAVGPIPEGLDIDHVAANGCTLTYCVNPYHLEPVTRSENLKRKRKKQAYE